MYFDVNGGGFSPISYENMNIFSSSYSPSDIHVTNTKLQQFFASLLFQKTIAVFKWTFPDTWNKDYFLYILYSWGYIGVIETDKYGIICQHGTRYGYDIFYQPTNLIITNPLLKGSLQPRINKECSVIKLKPDWTGALDLINFYADKMALCSESIDINLLNSHLCTVFPAEDETQAQSYKKLYDKVSRGEPCVVVDKKLFKEDGTIAWDVFLQNLKENYIVTDLISDLRKIEAEFDSRIGIKNNPMIDKKERMIKDEVNANNDETYIIGKLWFDSIQDGIKKTKELFPELTLSVEWRNDPEGGENNASNGYDVDNGAVSMG